MSAALERADVLYDVGRHDQAAALLADHLATEPDDAAALVLLARCRLRLKDAPGALTTVDQALHADPERVSAWLVRTDVLLALRAYGQAEQAAYRAVQLAPHHWGGHLALGTAIDRGGVRARRPQAYEAARTAVTLAPEEDAAHFLVGITAQRMGDLKTAQRAYETALRLNPDSSEAHNNLSLIHMRRRWRPGSWTRAAEGFVESAALDLEDREARYNLETMAWGTAAGARWVALAGVVAATAGSAQLRRGADGSSVLMAEAVGALVLAGLWAAWALWMLRRVPPRLRRPMLLVARRCRPAIAMAVAVALLGLHSLLVVALPTLSASVVGPVGALLFWTVVITYWASRAALNRRAPKG
ncbi:tetratricopeptide repeat protein [Streptomyces purpureus]|uniref:Tetratricopeptide repeat protein n=2 Tax=Streptomyces purpureus TaxID=1951 RepID=A0A918HA33_9ACTN|nr:tetratricopeptide repeat protein [Streptomyces purpureus]GGT47713.1 hypothetical protein GCM10014713_47190 [Streptomyces purpureus]